MDIKKLTSTVLSSDSLKGLSSLTGASKKEVSSVLTEALPTLLSGADKQAKGTKTAKSFVEALTQHAKDDTSSLGKFFGKVDLGDGAKIIGHLLGSSTDSVTEKVSKKTGVSADKTSAILSAAGPLLMSLLGQQKEEEEEKTSGLGGLLGGLLQNVDVGGLLTGLLGSDEEEEEEKPAEEKKKKTTAKKKTSTTAKKKESTAKKKTTSTAKKTTSTAKKTDSAAKKKTTSTAKKTTSTAKKTSTTAKKTSSTAKKASTTTKKTATKK